MLWLLLINRRDLDIQVHRVAQKTLCSRRQVGNPRISRIDAAIENGQRSLHEVQLRCVLELKAIERMLGIDILVVDRQLFAFDRIVDDRQHGRTQARERNRGLNVILKKLAYLSATSGRLDALLEILHRKVGSEVWKLSALATATAAGAL